MKSIQKVWWRIKFLFLESWGKDPAMVLYTVFPFVRSDRDGRIRLLVKRGIMTWNEKEHFFGFGGLTFYYGTKAPISDLMSIFLYHHPYIQKNFIHNSAFPFEGPYEQGAVTLAKGDVVVDAGANIGIFSLLAAQKVGPEGRVISFEPITEAAELLQKNIDANKLANTRVAPYALGSAKKKVQFSIDEGLLGSSSVFEKGAKTVEVEQVTLDEYVAEHHIPKVDFIKADIEGMERFLLQGGGTRD